MKSIVLFMLLMGLSSVGLHAQSTAPDSLYIVTYTTGSLWDKAKAPQDQPYFKEHSATLARMRKEGVIKLGARYADKGIIVIHARTLAAAKELIHTDAAVTNQLFSADIQKFNLFYEGCVERPK